MNTQLLRTTMPRTPGGLALPRVGQVEIEHLIEGALHQPGDAVGYYVSRWLTGSFSDKALLHACDGFFHLEEFADAGLCALDRRDVPFAELRTSWEDAREGAKTRAHNAWFVVTWQEQQLDVLIIHVGSQPCVQHAFILADTADAARRFYEAVCNWNAEVRDEVLVYNGYSWTKDEDLFSAIRGATFDNLLLGGTLKDEIRDDLAQFFASRAIYEQYGIPWKRGILFLGPPGNGKTHAVKALLNAMGKPCLYVKSLDAEDSIAAVFARARRSAPCILVLEDLDALVKPARRSQLLNEMDGFAANTGIVTLATTNHPEKLDPALIDRPSRFDRKYHFGLPATADRRAYLAHWNGTLQPPLRASEDAIDRAAERTGGFSYAYLKELCLSATMRWLVLTMPGAMDLVLDEQLDALRAQMAGKK